MLSCVITNHNPTVSDNKSTNKNIVKCVNIDTLKICETLPVKAHDIGRDLTGLEMPAIDTKFTYFNNVTSEITTEDAVFIYGGRNK